MITENKPDILFRSYDYSEKYFRDLLEKKHSIPSYAVSLAAKLGYTDLVKDYIEVGADIREHQNSPLELACKHGHTQIVKMLLEAGVRTTDSSTDEGYCLRISAYNNHVEIVKALLQYGADPMAQDYYALKLALDRNNMECVELLLDAIFEKRNQQPKQ